jgi:hypothetical protein
VRASGAALAADIDRSPYGNGLGRTLADRVLTAMATDLPLGPAAGASRKSRSAPRSRAAWPACAPGF